MSVFPKSPNPTQEELVAILCAPCENTLSTVGPENKRQRLQQLRNLKFSSEDLSIKRKESQKVLTNFAFKPCCNKKCIVCHFGKADDPEFFDFQEAKKCLDYFYDIYKFKTKDEYNNWLYDKFISTCYGLDEAGKIIHQYRLSYGNIQDPKTFMVCKEVWAYFFKQPNID